MKTERSMPVRLALLVACCAATVWGLSILFFTHVPMTFNDRLEDMSFAWYVPLFSLYVLWSERRELVASLGSASWLGALMTLPCLLLGFLGVRGIQVRFEMLSVIGLLITVPWAFFGRQTARRMLFPALFLLFCIPLATFLDVVTVHLRLLATGLASAVLDGIGAAVTRTGTMIAANDGSFAIDVAEPCSGLRSIFALMALTAGYAYFNQPTWLRRAILFAFSVPLAVLGNVMRIFSICLVGTYGSGDFATGFYHDYSGYVVFIVAIALMVLVGDVISRIARHVVGGGSCGARALPRAGQPTAVRKRRVLDVILPVLVTAVLVFVMTLLARTPPTTVCEPPSIAWPALAGYSRETQEISEAEKTVLPQDTKIEKFVYTAPNGDWFAVSVIVGGTSKSSIHRPELCLPSQGFLMTRPRNLSVGGNAWHAITLDGGGRHPSFGFAYTFFNQEGYRTSSHAARIFRDVWDRSFHNRIDRWVMVTVNASRTDDRGLEDFLYKIRGLVP